MVPIKTNMKTLLYYERTRNDLRKSLHKVQYFLNVNYVSQEDSYTIHIRHKKIRSFTEIYKDTSEKANMKLRG